MGVLCVLVWHAAKHTMAGLNPRDRSVLVPVGARFSLAVLEQVHAPLVLVHLLILLRVVAKSLADPRSMSRPACGGASLVGDMLRCVLYGDGACDGIPHELCAMKDGCMR